MVKIKKLDMINPHFSDVLFLLATINTVLITVKLAYNSVIPN